MTSEEARRKYSERLWRAFDNVNSAARVMPLRSAAGIVERAANELAKLFDEIAADGYYVELFQHVRDKNMRGIAFIPIPKKERHDHVNSLHEGTDSAARHQAEGAQDAP